MVEVPVDDGSVGVGGTTSPVALSPQATVARATSRMPIDLAGKRIDLNILFTSLSDVCSRYDRGRFLGMGGATQLGQGGTQFGRIRPGQLPPTVMYIRAMLLEREEALSRLTALADDAAVGRGSVALVCGEAGIGKTALVGRFAGDLDPRAHVLWGGCDDLITPRPLSPIHDMAGDEPMLRSALESGDRDSVFRAVLELLNRTLRATVMVVEDIHWADEATMDLVRFVGRRIDRCNGLLVLTYREGDGSDDRLRATLGDIPASTLVRIDLEPLSRSAVATMIDDERLDEVYSLTGGNPFLVSELAGSEAEVPPSIGVAMGARLARLGQEARRLVELASVVPGGVEQTVLRKIAGDTRDALAQSVESRILAIDSDKVGFRHELARRAVEQGLSESYRRELNLEVLLALEGSDADVVRCAHHARAAGDGVAMGRWLPHAARHAAALGSAREACEYLAAVEPHLGMMDSEELADLYYFWAWQEYLAEGERALTLAEQAIEMRRESGQSRELGTALTQASLIVWHYGDWTEAEGLAHQAIEVLTPVGGEELALAYARLSRIAMLRSDHQQTISHARQALDLVGDTPSPARVAALNTMGVGLANLSYPDGLAELEASFHEAAELGLHEAQAQAAGNLNVLHGMNLNFDQARHWIERGLEVVERVDMPRVEYWVRTGAAWAAHTAGDWSAATSSARDIYETPSVSRWVRFNCGLLLGRVQNRQGLPQGRLLSVDLWKQAEDLDAFDAKVDVGSVFGELVWLSQDASLVPEPLMKVLDTAWRTWSYPGAAEVAQWFWLAGLIELPEGAPPSPYRSLMEGEWEEVARLWEEAGSPYDVAVALSQGDQPAKLEALAIADRLGAVPLANLVRRDLRSRGVQGVPRGPRSERRQSPLGLTRRQAEVLELLGDGLSNAEIADHLYLSVRTVEKHVSMVLASLGAADRGEAVRIARDRAG